MREPDCTRIVPAKDLWELAIDFISRIDEKQMEFNLKYAYFTYKICKVEHVPNKLTKKLVFLSCFNDVGKLYSNEKSSNTLVETYLFLKYFSPLKNYADVLLYENKKIKLSASYSDGLRLALAKKYTEYLFDCNDKDEALNKIMEEKKNYQYLDILALNSVVHKTDIFYEINSIHYKTVIYKYISVMMFGRRERNKFFTMLASLFEMYSAQTLYHSKLTAIIAYKIARLMKIKTNRSKKIYVAGLAHDLGKVCIKLSILEKPDKLTDREYATMKKHVTYTKEILKNKMDYDIIEIAYRHHEKLDGSGYSNKYKDSEMTIDQKILQVSDIISALMAKRSYKEAWSAKKTIGILDDMVKENKLDASVVSCFKNNQEKIIKTSEKLMTQAEKIYEKINKEREELNKCEKEE